MTGQRGIVLAGGSGSRLQELTLGRNKHLLEVGGEPMLHHSLRKLAGAGIEEVVVVTGSADEAGMAGCLAAARAAGVHAGRLELALQPRPLGVADALLRGLQGGPPWKPGELLVVLLGDNLFEEPLEPLLEAHHAAGRPARIHLKTVEDPSHFGIAEVVGSRLLSIVEKPTAPASRLAVTGIYFYDERVVALLDGLRPSARGELEISALNQSYLTADELSYGVLDGWWIDAGTPESLQRAESLLSARPPFFRPQGRSGD